MEGGGSVGLGLGDERRKGVGLGDGISRRG